MHLWVSAPKGIFRSESKDSSGDKNGKCGESDRTAIVGLKFLHHIGCMSQSDLPSDGRPTKPVAQKPAAISAVHDERNKRKLAVAKLATVEAENELLRERLGNQELRNRELTLLLQAAETKATKYDAIMREGPRADSLAALGLRLDRNSGTLTGTPMPARLFEVFEEKGS
jgi:hypothetical protein